ncbi:hypothetical protein TNIN_186421 [Trichonephila inaurata madagascariensis]|uniref:Uncharacterized protein n=1 Tax=Trichonephila inaurata madagascariensis TaxID=2747483 RepID=A0A8X6WXK5_9ARAC|nr:hypothetical protein TNIN_186421 [Trichonephila inaurata madagascariensis]
MKLFWRLTTALICATALSPEFLFKPVLPMRPERRAALARKLEKLIDDYEEVNTLKATVVKNKSSQVYLRTRMKAKTCIDTNVVHRNLWLVFKLFKLQYLKQKSSPNSFLKYLEIQRSSWLNMTNDVCEQVW